MCIIILQGRTLYCYCAGSQGLLVLYVYQYHCAYSVMLKLMPSNEANMSMWMFGYSLQQMHLLLYCTGHNAYYYCKGTYHHHHYIVMRPYIPLLSPASLTWFCCHCLQQLSAP